MVRRQSRLLALMNGQVRRFQVAREAWGIEQRTGAAILLNLSPDFRKPLWVQGQFDRELFILFLRRSDQFRCADGS